MQLRKTKIPGCYEILPEVHKDRRGFFVKTFIYDLLRENKLETNFMEEYYTYSIKNVVRGLHFQVPPKAVAKMVYCVSGSVIDAVTDLRRGSPSYGTSQVFILSSENPAIIYIPEGLAHGFRVISESAVLLYKVTGPYSQAHDSGILWSSADIPWGVDNPILSERDKSLTKLENFKSTFIFK
jgi:dTDP-4-dehydrorhamnose 3,5-epimerase